MNNKLFAFIVCVDNRQFYDECKFYIDRLRMPYGYSAVIYPVEKASCPANGYNFGMAQTDALYKIYMQQNIFIINPNFLKDLLSVFEQDRRIGMVGMVGCEEFPPDAIMWHTRRVGNLYSFDPDNVNLGDYTYRKSDGYVEVKALEGYLLATRVDIPWREDLFTSGDFYDLAHSFEMRRRGYRLAVPNMAKPWVACDEGIRTLWNYDRYRRVFLKEYGNDM